MPMESETREEIAEAVHHIMDLVSDDPILFDLCERMTGWTEVVDDQIVTATNSHKYRVVEVNGSGQAIATADGTVTAGT